MENTKKAGCIIIQNGSILACVPYGKAHFKYNGLDLPKGTAEQGEDIEEVALRELEEETGINETEIDSIEFLGHFPYRELSRIYLYKLELNTEIDIKDLFCKSMFTSNGKEVPEHIGYKWVKFDDINTSFYKSLTFPIENSLKKYFNSL